MKFHDLALGQRFELDGVAYVKTSPVLASREDGKGNKFLARYVQVLSMDGTERRPVQKAERMLPVEAVLAAFDAYHARCREAMERLEGMIPADRLHGMVDVLEEERQVFLDVLLNG